METDNNLLLHRNTRLRSSRQKYHIVYHVVISRGIVIVISYFMVSERKSAKDLTPAALHTIIILLCHYRLGSILTMFYGF